MLKLIRVQVNGYKNCIEQYTIDFLAKSKKTSEDKEYELQEIAPGLFTFNTAAFIGNNASGKTSALRLLYACSSILSNFRLNDRYQEFGGMELELTFYHDDHLFMYKAKLVDSDLPEGNVFFKDEFIYRKKYSKSGLKDIYDLRTYTKVSVTDRHPQDLSSLFYVCSDNEKGALLYGSLDNDQSIYYKTFWYYKHYNLSEKLLMTIIKVFDPSIDYLEMADRNTYLLSVDGKEKAMNAFQLQNYLSSGTTKGIALYTMMAVSLTNGMDLLVDEIENHFHKSLVQNMISLYKEKSINKYNATLIFTTHHAEILDSMGRQDNIWICHGRPKISVSNMYESYNIRSVLQKSRKYNDNVFSTAVDYEDLMDLKRALKQ